MMELIIQTGKHRGKRLRVPRQEILIGRDETCQIRMTSTAVSRHHCRLRLSTEGIRIRDLGSRNGTFVNDAPVVAETLLHPGDQIRVGPMVFQVPKQESTSSPAKPTHRVSDSDIADWLAESDTAEGTTGPGDTTVTLPTMDTAPRPHPPEPEPPDAGPSPPPPSWSDRPKSIADEAAEIIHRYQQKARREQE